MRREFTAIYERDGDWIVAYCPEVPGANGQGRSKIAPTLFGLIRRTGLVEAVPRHTEIATGS